MKVKSLLYVTPPQVVTLDVDVPVESTGYSAVSVDVIVPVESGGFVAYDADISLASWGFAQLDAIVPVDSDGVSPFALGHGWNVFNRVDAAQTHTWHVQSVLFEALMKHRWTVIEDILFGSIPHTWRVVPNVAALFSDDVQQPTATVTKTP